MYESGECNSIEYVQGVAYVLPPFVFLVLIFPDIADRAALSLAEPRFTDG